MLQIEFRNAEEVAATLWITYPTNSGDDMVIAAAQCAAILGYPKVLSAGPSFTQEATFQSVWGRA